MASNLRAKPIEGYVTDSAGNILRNAQIIVKQETPGGSFPIDTVNSDDSGYFTTRPIPNGVYTIYESGIVVSRVIHNPDQESIQCFKANEDNYNASSLKNFSDSVDAYELNSFRAFLQIEASEKDIAQYGNTYPIYDFDITKKTNIVSTGDEPFHLSEFLGLSGESRITTTRFDVEYFFPLTALSNIYKRIRWAGVPAIRFYQDSKLVVPLDYYSIVPSNPKIIDPPQAPYPALAVRAQEGAFDYVMDIDDTGTYLNNIISDLKDGDIVKVFTNYPGGEADVPWYGIIDEIDSSENIISLEKWRSSRFTSDVDLNTTDLYVTRIIVFDGMFSGLLTINEDVNERFTITENQSAQNNELELYNYSNRKTE